MTPQERTEQPYDVIVAGEVCTVTNFEVCGYPSPTGAMKCVLVRGHDTKLFRYHQGFASNGSRRLWRVVKP